MTDIATAFENGSDEDQNFIQQLSLFLTGFFRSHVHSLEKPEHHAVLLEGHSFLAKISLVDDVEIFKICLEYWNKLVCTVCDGFESQLCLSHLVISFSNNQCQLTCCCFIL
jgi:exportin-1